MISSTYNFLGGAALVAFVIIGIYLYRMTPHDPVVFSPLQVLSSSWYNYKLLYVEPETYRTVDLQRNNVTTSEGQSYTMLRAVWQGDEMTFDKAWQWTQDNLAHDDDHLFSWMWGTRADGSTGVLVDQNGQNSASDADTDIALALLFAYARWQDPTYLEQARRIIQDIWEEEVVIIEGKPYLAANNVEKESTSDAIVVNPSYFSPAAYHLFSFVDTSHSWESLRENSYAVLDESMRLTSSRLPPDWVLVDRTSGEVTQHPNESLSSFGFDAMRVPFRIALDAEWFKNPKASKMLQELSFLSSAWEDERRLASSYAHDGREALPSESAAMYGGTLGYFMVSDPEAATAIYHQKLISLYDATTGGWSPMLSYYDNNWAWFGIALYNQLLPNLAAGLPSTAFIE